VFKRTEKGLAWEGDGVTTEIDYGANQSWEINSDFSFEAWFKSDGTVGSDYIIYLGEESTGKRRILILTSTVLTFNTYGTGLNSTGSYNDGKWHHAILTCTSAGSAAWYVDGMADGSGSVTLNDFDGKIAKVSIHNHILTPQERAQAYNEFLNAQPLSANKFPRHNPHSKPTDLSNEPGLVAAYNMIPSNGTLVDISGNGNNGTITGPISSVDGLVFDAADDIVTLGAALNVSSNSGTVVFRAKCDATTQRYGILGGHIASTVYMRFYNGAIQVRNGVNGSFAATLNADDTEWHTYTVVYDGVGKLYQDGVALTATGTQTDTIAFGKIGCEWTGTGHFGGTIEDLKIYNYAWDINDVKKYHNSFASRIVLAENFSDYPVS
jgi:hypothetical protein